MKLVVHVDGGARGNPGPAAAAAVLSTPEGAVVDEAAAVLGEATNNVAEYRGLLLGLERARERGATEVEVVNDSELIANQVNGHYRVKHPDMVPLHRAAREALAGFDRWSLRAVPRAENAAADALVNRALDGDPPPTTPGAHDELPVVVHQSCELWFGLILHELAQAGAELRADRPQAAVPPLQRVVAADRLLLDHLKVLETAVAPASGFESDQVGAIERESPALYGAFVACAGLPGERDARIAALADLYRDHAGDARRATLHQVAELLVDHDETFALWRDRGTPGPRFYPELWDVRGAL